MSDHEPLLLRRPHQATPLGAQVVVVAREAAPVVVSQEVAAALAACRGPATLAEHAHSACVRLELPDSARAGVAAGLAQLARHGFFCPWPTVPSDTPARLDIVGILTRNRPAALARCLESHLRHAEAHGRSLTVAIVDSSDDEGSRIENRAAALAATSSAAARLLYADRTHRRDFADRLAVFANIDPQLARFALDDVGGFGHDAGANRNALLLGLVDHAFLSSDDDVICEARRATPQVNVPRFVAQGEPTDVRLFETLEAAMAVAPPDPSSLFDAHERLLGRALPALVAEAAAGQGSSAIAPRFWDLCAEGRGRVRLSASALIGDSGARYPGFYAWSSAGARAQLKTADEDTYRRLLESRQLVRTAPAPTVTTNSFFMSTHVGIDGRQLLPPFFPVFRGQDHLFAAVLRAMETDALLAHVPQAVLHVPAELRRASMSALWDPPGARPFSALLMIALGVVAAGVPISSRTPRLRQLGARLRDLAMDPVELAARLDAQRVASAAPALARLMKEYDQSKGLDHPWVRDLGRLLEHRLAQLTAPLVASAREVVARNSEGAQVETAALLRRYGELLAAWPAIHEAARALAASGRGLFTSLA